MFGNVRETIVCLNYTIYFVLRTREFIMKNYLNQEELEMEWERFIDLSLYEKTCGDGYTWYE